MDNFDIIIRDGKVFDGTGNPWYKADIGIVGEFISSIGNLEQYDSNIDFSSV